MDFNAVGDVGTFALATLVFITYRIIVGHFLCRYGYQALAVWAAVGLVIVVIRILRDNVSVLPAEDAGQYAAIAYAVGAIILVNVILAERKYHRFIQGGAQ